MWKTITEGIFSELDSLGQRLTQPSLPYIPVKEGHSNAKCSISIAFDNSGSMKGRKIYQAKEAVNYSLKNCSNSIEVGLISFGLKVSTLSGLTYDHANVKSIIDSLKAKGTTNLLGALKASYKNHVLKSQTKAGIVFFTDGKPTDASCSEILAYGERIKRNEAKIVSVGIGENVNEGFLKSLASSEDDYYFAQAPEEIFSEITSAIGSLVTIK